MLLRIKLKKNYHCNNKNILTKLVSLNFWALYYSSLTIYSQIINTVICGKFVESTLINKCQTNWILDPVGLTFYFNILNL